MPALVKGSQQHRDIRNRAIELLKTLSKEEVVIQLRDETGLKISAQAVGNWATGWRNRGQGAPKEQIQLTARQEESVAADRARVAAEVAAKPHRCWTCKGITTAPKCVWCGGLV